jgi:hypothetical protein
MSFVVFDEINWPNEEAEEFALYWRSLRPAGEIPSRSEFDPTKITRLLPGISLYEVLSETKIMSRLVGTEVVRHIGVELTGRNLLDIYREDLRVDVGLGMKDMVDIPCGNLVKLTGVSRSGGTVGSIAVGFPLRDHLGECNRLIYYTCLMEEDVLRESRLDEVEQIAIKSSILIDISS